MVVSLGNGTAVKEVYGKMFVCDKHDRPGLLLTIFVKFFTKYSCVLVFYKQICLKEGAVWQKIC